ncbi:MAG: hypothetical protein ACRD2T_05855 [Thermoanaerobaculia bacterium]
MRLAQRAFLLTAAALLLGGLTLPAADMAYMAQRQLLLIHEEIANPSRLAAYESTTKEFIGALKASNATSFPSFDVVMTDDFSYFFVAPIKGFADVGMVPQGFAEVASKMGEAKFAEMMRRAGEPMVASNDSIVTSRPDLSYWPADYTKAANEAMAVNYDVYYILPGREMDAEAIAREWQALYKQKGMTEGYMIYQAITGHDLPVWAVAFYGKSPADLAAKMEAANAKLGAEGQALNARTLQLVRRFERRVGIRRPDLSYRAPAPMTAAN